MVKQSFAKLTVANHGIRSIPGLLKHYEIFDEAVKFLQGLLGREQDFDDLSNTCYTYTEIASILQVPSTTGEEDWLEGLKGYECSHYTLVHLSKRIEKLISKPARSGHDFSELFRDMVGRARYDQAFRERTLFPYPPAIQIELSKACNLSCPFCYQANPAFKKSIRPKEAFIDIEFYKKLIDAAKGKVPYIILASRGEPLMHPQFGELLKYLHDGFLDVKLNTNAMFLTRELCSIVLDHVDTLVVSVDSHEKEVYESLRVNAKFSLLVQNLELLRDVRSSHPRRNQVTIRVSGVDVPWAKQDYILFKNFFLEYADDVVLVEYVPWERIYELDVSEAKTSACSELWTMLYVWSDGSINCCDVDNMSKLLGVPLNIDCSDPINNAWMSMQMQKLRRLHVSGERKELTPCNVCPN